MKTRFFALPTLILILALFPTLVSGDAPSITAAAASNPLAFVEAVFDAGVEGPNCIALSPDGQHVYVTSDIDDAVAVFRRDDASGRLDFVEVKRDGEGGANELEGATGVAVSPDGKSVYVVSDKDDALTVFSRDGTSGELTFVEAHKDGVGGIVSLNGAHGVVVSPDGAHVYVASRIDDTVSAFSRDTSTGALTFVEAEGVVSGLDATYSVAISPIQGAGGFACRIRPSRVKWEESAAISILEQPAPRRAIVRQHDRQRLLPGCERFVDIEKPAHG